MAAIPNASFDAYAPDYYRREHASHHYTLAVKTCMGLVDLWHEKYAKDQPVQYIFDYTETGRGEIADIWKMMAQEPEAAAGGGLRPDGWSIQKKDVFKPLQAADILAWNQYSNMGDDILKGSQSFVPISWRSEFRPGGISRRYPARNKSAKPA